MEVHEFLWWSMSLHRNLQAPAGSHRNQSDSIETYDFQLKPMQMHIAYGKLSVPIHVHRNPCPPNQMHRNQINLKGIDRSPIEHYGIQ